MSAIGLISGRLVGEPATRPTRNGGTVNFFKLKVTNGSAIEWWEVAAFGEKAMEELEGLREGDAVSAAGVVHSELFEFKGEKRIKRSLTAHRVLALRTTAARLPDEERSRTGRDVAEASWAAPQKRGGGAHGELI
jgi:hypothetical protein